MAASRQRHPASRPRTCKRPARPPARPVARETANVERVEVEIEHRRLELWDKRLTPAFKWLGFLNTQVVRDDAGNVTLIMTNQSMTDLLGDVRELKKLSAPEVVDDTGG